MRSPLPQENATAAAANVNADEAATPVTAAAAATTCVIHCLETGDKLPANQAQIMEMSGTIKAMVEDCDTDEAGAAAAAAAAAGAGVGAVREIPLAGISGDVAKGLLKFITAHYDKGAKDSTDRTHHILSI